MVILIHIKCTVHNVQKNVLLAMDQLNYVIFVQGLELENLYVDVQRVILKILIKNVNNVIQLVKIVINMDAYLVLAIELVQ